MAPPSDHPCLELSVKDTPFFVKKLEPSAIIPEFFLKEFAAGYSGRFLSITRTPDEISIVGEAHDSYGMLEEEVKWRCIKIAGPMDFGLTGVLASFTAPLKVSGVPVFAVSTWDTDWILVPSEKKDEAIKALKGDGWVFA